MARNIRRRKEQFPSNTLIVSVMKEKQIHCLVRSVSDAIVVAFSPSSLSSLSFSFFSLSFSPLCAESLRALELDPIPLGSDFPYSSSRKRAASPLLKSSDMLRAVDEKVFH